MDQVLVQVPAMFLKLAAGSNGLEVLKIYNDSPYYCRKPGRGMPCLQSCGTDESDWGFK